MVIAYSTYILVVGSFFFHALGEAGRHVLVKEGRKVRVSGAAVLLDCRVECVCQLHQLLSGLPGHVNGLGHLSVCVSELVKVRGLRSCVIRGRALSLVLLVICHIFLIFYNFLLSI